MSELQDFLNAELNIRRDASFLLNFFSRNAHTDRAKEKDEFFNKLQLIFFRLLSLNKKSHKISLSSNKKSTSLVELLNSNAATIEEFDLMIHLFIPNRTLFNFFNLFYESGTSNPTHMNKEYQVDINNNIFSVIDSLLKNGKVEYLLKNLSLIQNCAKDPNIQALNLKNGRLVLTCFEYFLMILLLAIKDSEGESKVDLKTQNPNFRSLPTYTKSLSEKTKIILEQIDTERSLQYNFYVIVFRSILRTLIKRNDVKNLKYVTCLVEFIWLSDYYLIRSNYNVYTSNFENYNTFVSTFTKYGNQIPNLIIIECLKTLICFLQGKAIDTGKGEKGSEDTLLATTRKTNFEILKIIDRSLFFFFKYCFRTFPKVKSFSELKLFDIAEIWLAFINPWSENEIRKLFDERRMEKSYDNVLYTKINELNNFSHSKTDNEYWKYVIVNIIFYTETLNDFFYSFSSIDSSLTLSDLNIIKELIYIYDSRSHQKDKIIFDLVNLAWLSDMANGKINNTKELVESYNTLAAIGYPRQGINVFNSSFKDNLAIVKNIYNNNQFWIKEIQESKLDEKQKSLYLQVLQKFKKLLENLFQLKEREVLAENRVHTKESFSQNEHTILKKNRIVTSKDIWGRRLSSDENFISYHFALQLARLIDVYYKDKPIHVDEQGNKDFPETNLRYMASNYFIIQVIFTVMLLYFFAKLLLFILI